MPSLGFFLLMFLGGIAVAIQPSINGLVGAGVPALRGRDLSLQKME